MNLTKLNVVELYQLSLVLLHPLPSEVPYTVGIFSHGILEEMKIEYVLQVAGGGERGRGGLTGNRAFSERLAIGSLFLGLSWL
ncbi:hypothetical protein VNO77_27761 [Canavalia gladiata]|uniref:Uncharacterized protein n=1 Tax=Canavalia gladiata TaxID=3824 RepID=A0AAN9KXH3_CANGL